MHPVLWNDDIFRIICSAVKAPRRHRTLAALAITCRAFNEAALDNLWEYLCADDLKHVLALFPDGLFVQGGLTRPIMPIDWDRPHLYVSRVKTMTIWPTDYDEILKAMGPACPSGGLFPNLRCLGCRYIPSDDLTPLRVLLHPQLKEFSIYFTPSTSNLSLLSALPLVCPNLTSMNLWFEGGDYPETAVFISSIVPTLKALESLCLDNWIGALGLVLLPKLTDLHLSGPTAVGSLPRLRCLTIEDVDTVSVIELFRSVTDVDLAHLSLDLSPLTTTSQMDELVRALASVASPPSLQTLRLQPHEGMPTENAMTVHTLHELSFFCGLKTVEIEWLFEPHFDDTTLETLTAAWTQLTDLKLIQPLVEDDKKLTLKSLLSLARNCPHLQCFYLMVDAREVPELPPVAPQRSLKWMYVPSSPIQNATQVARYLAGIFPDVEHIESHPGPLWYQVLKQLPEFVSVRREEAEKIRAG
ncbi:hypothetical protein C8R45DRAFT_1107786 [Mycena sanguinolenta]|nr:hypothetical protein C8R45DRAFT_1107786 [Mycena sanguinolenta]